jgi:uncharacterized membrane protein YozB (DUF420 family)
LGDREDRPAKRRLFRGWFPPLFLFAVGLGALLFASSFLLLPSSQLAAGAAELNGPDYAKTQLPAFDRNPLLVHGHATLGLTLLLLAPFQFWQGLRSRFPVVHRIMGYVTATCLVLLAVTGVAVSIVYPFAGPSGIVPNVVWMTAILVCVGMAISCIRRRDVLHHQAWMTRAIAMTLGVTLSTVYLPILGGVLKLAPLRALAVSFWLGVVECLVLAELWLNRPGGRLARARKR